MRPKVIATAVATASVAAVGLAGPAFATDQITQNAVGTYEFKGKSVGKRIWTATPCADDAPQCIRVTEYDADDVARANPNWSGNAHWQVGSWIMFVVVPNAIECEDGTEHDFRVNYSWDAVENTGQRSFNDPGICDDEATTVANPFTLTRMGPPPPPSPASVAPPPGAVNAPLLPPGAAEAPPLPPGVPPGAAEAPPAPAE